jgi:integrase
MKVDVKALRYAYVNGYIQSDPTIALMGYSSKVKKRGVLTPEEAMALFCLKWTDYRALLANLVAMSTGLRTGEIMALRMENIGEVYLTINYSYSREDGLKCTKTEEPRRVPIIPSLRDALVNLGKQNPHENGFIFFCEKPDCPWDQEGPLLQLKKMLVRMRMGNMAHEKDPIKRKQAKEEAVTYWKKRNVVFHSWRHFYASRMIGKLEARKVMLATGHKTESVFNVYAEHAKKPAVIVTARYGITDTGLRRACDRLGVKCSLTA